MAERDLEEEYRRILAESRERGDVLEAPPGAERRVHPRLKVHPEAMPGEVDPWVAAIDISISGMAFFAGEPVQPGNTITINPAEGLTADVEVVGCQEVPQEEGQSATRFRLHCRFASEEEGMRVLVGLKELEGGAA